MRDFEIEPLRLDWATVHQIDSLYRECEDIEFEEAVELVRRNQRHERRLQGVDEILE